jgi:hypothetical protein
MKNFKFPATQLTFRAALVGFLLGWALPAQAQDPAAQQALFNEAKQLRDQGRIDEACPKFEAAFSAGKSTGALLSLADCHERQGKTATAWAEFLEVERRDRLEGRQDRAEEAKSRATRLEAKLSYLTLRVTAPVTGFTLLRAGIEQKPGAWGTRSPVDPGPHQIVAKAPGYADFHQTVRIGAAKDSQELVIPPLQALAVGPPAGTGAPASSESGSKPKLWGYVAAGTGAAALVTGAVFGAVALSHNSKAKQVCGGIVENCPPEAQDYARDEASLRNTQAWVSNIGIGAGLVGLGVGAYLLFSSPGESAAATPRAGRWSAAPVIGRGSGGVQISGAF